MAKRSEEDMGAAPRGEALRQAQHMQAHADQHDKRKQREDQVRIEQWHVEQRKGVLEEMAARKGRRAGS